MPRWEKAPVVGRRIETAIAGKRRSLISGPSTVIGFPCDPKVCAYKTPMLLQCRAFWPQSPFQVHSIRGAAQALRLGICDAFRTRFRKMRFIPGDRTINPIDNMLRFPEPVPFPRITH